MELSDVVVISAVRTAMGKFGGTLRNVPAYDLGVHTIKESLNRVGLEGKDVDEVILGHCRQAGNGPNPVRTASVRAGIPASVPAHSLNMACPSGMKALILASQAIRLKEAEIMVVGGMESMSTIPYLLKDARWDGFKMGDKVLMDGWNDTIDPLCNMGMGQTAERLQEKYNIPREEQDKFALESHKKAHEAQINGWFSEEIVPFEVLHPDTKKPVIFTTDETIRPDTSLEKLSRLKPVFKQNGTVTAGNSCSMSDGATALVVTSREKAKSLGVEPLFSIVSHATAAVDPDVMGEGPSISMPMALKNVGMTLSDMDLIEVNEAFAVQILANEMNLKWDRNKLNVHGGAIALGHPTGISGARILVTLYYALKRIDKEIGIAGICGGGGVTTAMVIKREK